MDWDLLRTFLAFARTGKLMPTASALKLHYSTLQRNLARLERQLSVKLFEHAPGAGYSLTPQGFALLKYAEEIESTVFAIQSAFANKNTRTKEVVRIGTPDAFGTMFLAPRLGRLAELHSRLEIQLIAVPTNFSLSKREADIAIGLSRPDRGPLHARRLTDYEFGIYVSKDRTDLISQIKSPNDLAQHVFVSYIDDLIFAPELEFLTDVLEEIIPRLKSSSLLAQLQVVASGAGFGILPCFLADGHPSLTRVLVREVALIRTFWMVVHSEMRNLPRIRAVGDFIASEVRSAGRLFLPSHRPAGP
ncbi:MAG: LysR family transcriptional regulator [Pseudomonadota bacterium]